jgi:hypothetical protein
MALVNADAQVPALGYEVTVDLDVARHATRDELALRQPQSFLYDIARQARVASDPQAPLRVVAEHLDDPVEESRNVIAGRRQEHDVQDDVRIVQRAPVGFAKPCHQTVAPRFRWPGRRRDTTGGHDNPFCRLAQLATCSRRRREPIATG